MIIYYRLRGSSGEATEDEINELKEPDDMAQSQRIDETKFK